MSIILGRKPGGSGGGSGAPSGPAGGSLSGTYPDPGIAAGAVDTAEIANDAVDADKIDGADAADIRTVVDVAAASGWMPANETWTYASADSPTFTFTISGDLTGKYSPGMRLQLTQTTVKYFIVTAVSHAAGTTTITVYGGTDYTLANAAISANSYSVVKAPQGFPLDPTKWTVKVTDTTQRSQSTPTQNTWYNVGTTNSQISIPIGVWDVDYSVAAQISDASNVAMFGAVTLSTANNSASDTELSSVLFFGNTPSAAPQSARSKVLVLAAKTTYFLNFKTLSTTIDSLVFQNADAAMVIRARCAYL